MNESEYRNLPCINWSTLSAGRKSMAHLRHAIEHGREDTESFAFGRAVHMLALQPENWDREFAVAPKCDRRTKAGREEYAEWSKDAAGREPVTQSEYFDAKRVADAVRGNSEAMALLEGAEIEKPLIWTDPASGLQCKGRCDAIRPEAIVDLKTSKSCAPRSFTSSVFNFGYHAQLSFYCDGAAVLDGHLRSAVIIAVEVTRPHVVQLFRLSEEALLLGRQEYRRLLDLYVVAKQTDKWSGYADGEIVLYPPPHLVEAVEAASTENHVAVEEPF